MSDVAKRAGVSLSTVSYTLNGTRPISAATRARVFAAMQELDYRRNEIARGLASKRTRILGLLFPAGERGLGITDFEFVKGATEAARKLGYYLILWPAAVNSPDELTSFVQQGVVDGLIVMEVLAHDSRILALRTRDFPFVMIGRCADSTGMAYVDIDFDATMERAIAHLFALGHRRFALVNQAQEDLDAGYGPAVRTQAAFLAAMQGAGMAGHAICCHANPQAGYAAYQALAGADPQLTAVLVMNERAVPGVLHAIAAADRPIPAAVSVLALVSSPKAAETTLPPLTTLAPSAYDMGQLAVELLIRRLEGNAPELQQVLLPCSLVLGASTGPAPAKQSGQSKGAPTGNGRLISA